MNTMGKNKFGIVLALGALIATPSFAASTVWVARLTGNLSCQQRLVKNSGLVEAIGDLEKSEIEVKEAKVGRLNDRMFCMSCDCPDGTFNIVKVKASPEVEKVIKEGDWEKVEASEIIKDEDSGHAAYKILPVIPEI